MFESPDAMKPAHTALTCLTEVELAMIGGRMARAFRVDDALWTHDLLAEIDQASASIVKKDMVDARGLEPRTR